MDKYIMDMPHTFPTLIESTKQTVLIVGTGLSAPTAPTIESLKGKLDEIAIRLAVDTNGSFYKVAENILDSLVGTGKTDAASRLWLAEELGLLDDRCWFGEIGLPLSGNTPRHRIIARFVVEDRLMAIVSLNWDALLETALDSVGLSKDVASTRPWPKTGYISVIDDRQMSGLANGQVFAVIKPHGCVRNLEMERRLVRSSNSAPSITFKLKQSELGSFPKDQTGVDKYVEVCVGQCPLIAVGWKATENYLRETIVKRAKSAMRAEIDAFTLISRSWYPDLINPTPNETYHDEIAFAYNKTRDDAFAFVGKLGQPNLDCLFLWLQARYALNKLIPVTPVQEQAVLQNLLQQIQSPICDHPVLRWADSWLPTWVRLCWRAGAMHGNDPHTNRRVGPSDIPIMPRDVHVPLCGMSMDRRDLQAASKLLVVLGGDLNRFNYEKFPGGFLDGVTSDLYIPLPGWRGQSDYGDLGALKPLVEALRGLGFVRKIYLVWIDSESTPLDQFYCNQLAAKISRLMPHANFAAVDALSWIDLDTLKKRCS